MSAYRHVSTSPSGFRLCTSLAEIGVLAIRAEAVKRIARRISAIHEACISKGILRQTLQNPGREFGQSPGMVIMPPAKRLQSQLNQLQCALGRIIRPTLLADHGLLRFQEKMQIPDIAPMVHGRMIGIHAVSHPRHQGNHTIELQPAPKLRQRQLIGWIGLNRPVEDHLIVVRDRTHILHKKPSGSNEVVIRVRIGDRQPIILRRNDKGARQCDHRHYGEHPRQPFELEHVPSQGRQTDVQQIDKPIGSVNSCRL